MSIRVQLRKGPHIKTGNIHLAFGQMCGEAETTPYITMGASLPYIKSLPANIAAVCEKVSQHSSFPNCRNDRIQGEYVWKTAVGKLEGATTKEMNDTYHLTIEARDVADASELYSLIRGGLIHPTVSYDAQTVPAPARQIRQLLREIREVIRRDVIVWWTKQTARLRTA